MLNWMGAERAALMWGRRSAVVPSEGSLLACLPALRQTRRCRLQRACEAPSLCHTRAHNHPPTHLPHVAHAADCHVHTCCRGLWVCCMRRPHLADNLRRVQA